MENLTIRINGDNTTKLLEVYSIGPVDNTTTALQGPCGGYPCDITQNLETPINMNITYPYNGTWIVKLIQLEAGIINYTISSNYPIQKKPIIKIPECNICHNSDAVEKAYTNDKILTGTRVLPMRILTKTGPLTFNAGYAIMQCII